MNCKEEWRPIAGWPHEVSNLGRVRRTEPACGVTVGQIIRDHADPCGYRKVSLRRRAGRPQKFMVHRLVAEAFIGPPPGEGYTVNHRDGVKAHNAADNLEWLTQGDNQRHAYETGLKGRGERHGNAKLTEEQVREIRRRFDAGGVTQTALAGQYGVSQPLIGGIVRRKTWTHIE